MRAHGEQDTGTQEFPDDSCFTGASGAPNGSTPATIVIRVMPDAIGSVHGSFTVAGTQLDFSQFVYP